MKTRILTLAALAALLLGTSYADDDSPLERSMGSINRSFRAIKKNVADPSQKALTLEQIAMMRQSAVEAQSLQPSMTKTVPAADQAKFIEGYKAEIGELISAIDALQKAVDAGNAADAQKAITDITEIRNAGHAEFIKKGGEKD